MLIGAAAAVSLPRRMAAASGQLAATRLGDHVVLVSGAGGNVVVADGGDRALMIDGGSRDRSADLLALVAEQTGGMRIGTLFNTDWHPDHTGSNETLARGGTRILSHARTRQYLANEVFVEWENRTYAALPAAAQPTETFYTGATITVGAEHVEYGPLGPAHTDGDIYVFLRDSNVLAAGDVVTVGAYPMPDYTSGGWLGGLVAATKTLLDLSNAETRIVPGSGAVRRRADLQAQYDMLSALRDRFVKMMKQGMGVEDMLAAGATKDFDASWGAPEMFVANSYRGLWLHVRELGGIV
jgi:glyoxylase-like metal-dependent hydrolase (beta-lactamase superfamily II)